LGTALEGGGFGKRLRGEVGFGNSFRRGGFGKRLRGRGFGKSFRRGKIWEET
jgi:hypothetical protein